jgi:hypothetical protein
MALQNVGGSQITNFLIGPENGGIGFYRNVVTVNPFYRVLRPVRLDSYHRKEYFFKF